MFASHNIRPRKPADGVGLTAPLRGQGRGSPRQRRAVRLSPAAPPSKAGGDSEGSALRSPRRLRNHRRGAAALQPPLRRGAAFSSPAGRAGTFRASPCPSLPRGQACLCSRAPWTTCVSRVDGRVGATLGPSPGHCTGTSKAHKRLFTAPRGLQEKVPPDGAPECPARWQGREAANPTKHQAGPDPISGRAGPGSGEQQAFLSPPSPPQLSTHPVSSPEGQVCLQHRYLYSVHKGEGGAHTHT